MQRREYVGRLIKETGIPAAASESSNISATAAAAASGDTAVTQKNTKREKNEIYLTHQAYLLHQSLILATPTTTRTLPSHLHTGTIEENWGADLDTVLGHLGIPESPGEMETWDHRLLPILALLSHATAGQVQVVGRLVERMVVRRASGEWDQEGETGVRVFYLIGVLAELYI